MLKALVPILMVAVTGCHGIHHFVYEPLTTRAITVETDDRWNFVLDEPAGCEWDVVTSCENIRWKIMPDEDEKDKTTVRIYVLRGFARDEVVTLVCRRKRDRATVREVQLFFNRTAHDRASWK